MLKCFLWGSNSSVEVYYLREQFIQVSSQKISQMIIKFCLIGCYFSNSYISSLIWTAFNCLCLFTKVIKLFTTSKYIHDFDMVKYQSRNIYWISCKQTKYVSRGFLYLLLLGMSSTSLGRGLESIWWLMAWHGIP